MKKIFRLNERVIVSVRGGWKRDCKGKIVSNPEPVDTVQGPEYYYWIQFDEPEEDINGPDQYSKAQVLSQYIEIIT